MSKKVSSSASCDTNKYNEPSRQRCASPTLPIYPAAKLDAPCTCVQPKPLAPLDFRRLVDKVSLATSKLVTRAAPAFRFLGIAEI